MLIAHRGMNISEAEFMAVLEDVLAAMSKHGIGQREQDEVLVILFPLRKDIIHV
jgi:hemoglobin